MGFRWRIIPGGWCRLWWPWYRSGLELLADAVVVVAVVAAVTGSCIMVMVVLLLLPWFVPRWRSRIPSWGILGVLYREEQRNGRSWRFFLFLSFDPRSISIQTGYYSWSLLLCWLLVLYFYFLIVCFCVVSQLRNKVQSSSKSLLKSSRGKTLDERTQRKRRSCQTKKWINPKRCHQNKRKKNANKLSLLSIYYNQAEGYKE